MPRKSSLSPNTIESDNQRFDSPKTVLVPIAITRFRSFDSQTPNFRLSRMFHFRQTDSTQKNDGEHKYG